jgi:hypothetical protein
MRRRWRLEERQPHVRLTAPGSPHAPEGNGRFKCTVTRIPRMVTRMREEPGGYIPYYGDSPLKAGPPRVGGGWTVRASK